MVVGWGYGRDQPIPLFAVPAGPVGSFSGRWARGGRLVDDGGAEELPRPSAIGEDARMLERFISLRMS